jgi:hypothetical protein
MSSNRDSFLPQSEKTPIDVGIPIFWVDASDASRRIVNGNHEVLGGFEKSEFKHRMRQSSPSVGSPPSLRSFGKKQGFTTSVVNGLALEFPFSPISEVTMFFVYDDNNGTLLENDDGSIVVSDSEITVGSATGAAPAKLSDNDPHILVIYWSTSDGNLWYKFDGDSPVILDTDTTRLSGTSQNWALLNNFAQDNGVTGVVGEIILYGSRLQSFHINRVGKYLCSKWDLNWSDI